MAKKEDKASGGLAGASAARLRDIALATKPGAQIGSLREVAAMLGVGIVTVQQAARVLEHEGLLQVRRGPGGGYYASRPDEAALERAMAAYLRVNPGEADEALEMISLLECEMIADAAACPDDGLHEKLAALGRTIDGCDTSERRLAFERALHDLLFRMAEKPLIELLARVTMTHYEQEPSPVVYRGGAGQAAWSAWRRAIVRAILERDAPLARFEATRHRDAMIRRVRAHRAAADGRA
ncbi:MAG: GntR family transcriptional regulator [Sphingomonas sp.]